MSQAEVEAVAGRARPDGPPVQDSDGRWLWGGDLPADSRHVIVEGPTARGPWTVSFVTLLGRSRFKTKAGLKIGMSRAKAEKLYPTGEYDPHGKRDEITIVSLSAEESLLILYEDGRVWRLVLRNPRDCVMNDRGA